ESFASPVAVMVTRQRSPLLVRIMSAADGMSLWKCALAGEEVFSGTFVSSAVTALRAMERLGEELCRAGAAMDALEPGEKGAFCGAVRSWEIAFLAKTVMSI